MGGLFAARVRYRFYSALHSPSAYAYAPTAESSIWAHRIGHVLCLAAVHGYLPQVIKMSLIQYRDFYWLFSPFEAH